MKYVVIWVNASVVKSPKDWCLWSSLLVKLLDIEWHIFVSNIELPQISDNSGKNCWYCLLTLTMQAWHLSIGYITAKHITKQCNLVPVTGQRCPATGKVTVGLASYWPCISLKWFIHLRAQGLSKGDEHPTNTPHGVWYSTFFNINWIWQISKQILFISFFTPPYGSMEGYLVYSV